MKVKLILLCSVFLSLFCSSCISQSKFLSSKKLYSKTTTSTLYKVMLENNYSDSVVLIPLALGYKLGMDTLNSFESDIDTEKQVVRFYLSIDKYTIGNLVKYYRLGPKESIAFLISIDNKSKEFKQQLVTLFYKFANNQLRTTERYIMQKPTSGNLEENILLLN